ncbi:fumarylacetoacetate (FAA) hydrolase family domain-containing protein [Ditylenchus destructor]|nr:fumarylacetoacetate (FAA) hydrolase family domain-containing protein [Ditylenchus destructor]
MRGFRGDYDGIGGSCIKISRVHGGDQTQQQVAFSGISHRSDTSILLAEIPFRISSFNFILTLKDPGFLFKPSKRIKVIAHHGILEAYAHYPSSESDFSNPRSGLARFVPKGFPSETLIAEPENHAIDVGLALYKGETVKARVFNGNSVLEPGAPSGEVVEIDRVLSPLTQAEVGTIRCIGLNYKEHAAEAGLEPPTIPTAFLKPDTSLGDPYPAPTILPKITQVDDCGDYESELAIVIGKEYKNVSEADAYDYVLGYTAANDVSSRTSQFAQSQWSFSKGFDGACPIGPVIVSKSIIPDPQKLNVRGLKNGQVMQECSTDDLIFSVPKIVSFLSQGTTLKPGTIIITGTPAGVGMARKPQVTIREDDVFFCGDFAAYRYVG